jgi:TonB family protein
MKTLGLLCVMLSCTALAAPQRGNSKYETDRGTVGFLHYNLLSGGEITFPPEAVRQNLQGSGFFLMRLRPDGVVVSVTTKMSTGHTALDQHIIRLLKNYRFRPGTKQPLQWLVGFIQPSTVIVKLNLVKEQGPPSRPKK